MRNFLYMLLAVAVLTACSGSSNESKVAEETSEATAEEATADAASEATAEEEEIVEVASVCIWEKLSVRAEPKKDGKWLTSLAKGEKLTTTGQVKADDGDNGREYVKVVLADGTEGWSLRDLIAEDAYPVAVLKECDIYKRPDILTKSDKSFKQFDIIAVKNVDDKFAEVVGQRREGKWIDKGYLIGDNLTDDDIDLAVAKFAGQALLEESDSVKREKLDEILTNEMFQNSKFYVAVEELYDTTL